MAEQQPQVGRDVGPDAAYNRRRDALVGHLREHGPLTSRDLAHGLGWDPHEVAGKLKSARHDRLLTFDRETKLWGVR